jgi:Tol biopolymer transport system component
MNSQEEIMHTFDIRRGVLVIIGVLLLLSLAAIPASATFPGKNGKIVMVANTGGSWQLYTVDSDGSNFTQITNMEATDWEAWTPHFSPDGKQIAFSYGVNGAVDIYVVGSDGTGLTQITNDGVSWFPNWSADGKQLVFAKTNIVYIFGINVVTTMRSDGHGKQHSLSSPVWDSLPAAFTPDGKQIAFYTQQGGLVAAAWTMNADGSDKRRITPAGLEGVPTDISPNGERVLLMNHVNTDLPNNSLFSVRTNGTDLVRLTNPGKTNADVFGAYSPDGKQIVFVSNRGESDKSLDLYTMNADGSNLHRIATGLTVGGCPDGNCVNPSWGSATTGHTRQH